MPQLDFIIAFSQIFWLILIFFSFYTILVHFFLPQFIKTLKSRKQIVLENNEMLLKLHNDFNNKQYFLNSKLKENFTKIKSLLDKEIFSNFGIPINFFNLDLLDKKISGILYNNTLYYDIHVLESISLTLTF